MLPRKSVGIFRQLWSHFPGAAMSDAPALESLDDDCVAQLACCQERIGYQFRDPNLLTAALTHASGAAHRLASNERMEFLGDAVLGMIVCERLYHDYPEYLEGELTRIKSIVVSRETCAKISRKLGLADFLIMGKGMSAAPTVPPSLLADVLESLLAAIYLDRGMDAARKFVDRHVIPEVRLAIKGQSGGNYKSQLQQLAQREFGATPAYHLIDEKGPDHNKSFQISAQIAGKCFPPAWGRNKKEAEQRAASNALSALVSEQVKDDSCT